MTAIEASLNGKKLCTVEAEQLDHFRAMLVRNRGSSEPTEGFARFEVKGIEKLGKGGEALSWTRCFVKPGDELLLRIVEAPAGDPPAERHLLKNSIAAYLREVFNLWDAHRPKSSDSQAGEEPTCSFCGKGKGEVRKLIAGASVFICNECVGLCVGILHEDGIES